MATRKCRSLTLREILNEAAGLLLHPKNIVYERVADTQLLQYAVIRELHRGHLILEMVSNHVLLKRSKVLFWPEKRQRKQVSAPPRWLRASVLHTRALTPFPGKFNGHQHVFYRVRPHTAKRQPPQGACWRKVPWDELEEGKESPKSARARHEKIQVP
jgi:hypothetical protein